MSESKKSAEQIEQERLTRRQALRKLGFGAGLSAFMLLGVDDLARMVGKELERRAGDSRVADQIAKEFQDSGVALAVGPSCVGCTDSCTPDDSHDCVPCDCMSGSHRLMPVPCKSCSCCRKTYNQQTNYCTTQVLSGKMNQQQYQACQKAADDNYASCALNHHC